MSTVSDPQQQPQVPGHSRGDAGGESAAGGGLAGDGAGSVAAGSGSVAASVPELDLPTVLQALSDPVRLDIVSQLADGCEHRCGGVDVPVTKSTCSHHFRVLREAGVISTRVEGKSRLNRLERERLDQHFPGLLDSILAVGVR